MSEIKCGEIAFSHVTVDATNTAQALNSGSLPVFATPMMIALMENAAMRAISHHLEDTESSVGIQINVSHDLASPIGAEIIAKATVIAVDRRKITFEVEAKQGDKTIGKGTHTRFIVTNASFLNKISL
ncbi:dihydrolipoamide acyltransferase [Lactococcus hircilactis]|mgnify:CR=1 FL=1|uniref:Dihydrolipoamide acyltransferase n=1 Tax=Lactococcus hircilactis TaxID=1494462 RepID=A0A7X2D2G7_9LACT|nr:thioesterase family protein [Lactococcus hircilactis]MQW40447.1 dihydrolipoamide acyltransferase [Lactococcus hircilactis]